MSAAGILRDIVRVTIESERDVTIVADVENRVILEETLERTSADVVIWPTDADVRPDACLQLLLAHPRLKVLTVEDDGRRGFLWELRSHRTPIGELTPASLTAAIRGALTPDDSTVP
jgi:hypothetical protein